MKQILDQKYRIPFILAVIGLLFFAVGTTTFAAIYTIDTDDGSISEWAAQGIPVFQTDPTGDTQNGGTPNDDIVQTWVATGNNGNTLYFLMELNADPALDADSNRSAAASIDCDNDGIDQEPEDRIVTYWPQNDWVIISQGDQSYYTMGTSNQGQRVGKYVEWGVDLDQLPPDDQTPDVNCRGAVKIRFGTADNATSPATILDDTSPLRGWNIPTAINLQEIQARHNVTLAGAALLAFLGLGFLGGSAYAFQRSHNR